jgi:hypothetical protein
MLNWTFGEAQEREAKHILRIIEMHRGIGIFLHSNGISLFIFSNLSNRYSLSKGNEAIVSMAWGNFS